MDRPKEALSHVLWIGGPPDSGKTTVADLLGVQYKVPVYHFDQHEMEHIRRADPERHPAMNEIGRRLAAPDVPPDLEWGWVLRTPEEMAESATASWSERIDLVAEDLLAMPGDHPIVAEGPGFFPEVILPRLSSLHQAIWLIPMEAFKRASHERRGKVRLWGEASNPERARRNHLERDLLMAESYRRAVRELGLPSITIDGSRSAESVAADLAGHFGLLLGTNAVRAEG